MNVSWLWAALSGFALTAGACTVDEPNFASESAAEGDGSGEPAIDTAAAEDPSDEITGTRDSATESPASENTIHEAEPDTDLDDEEPGDHEPDDQANEAPEPPDASSTTELAPDPEPGLRCVLGDTRCINLDFQTCEGSGAWLSSETCVYGCNDEDGCLTQCEEGTRICVGPDQVSTCNPATGNWNAPLTCAEDGVECTVSVCEANACVNKRRDNACIIGNVCYSHNDNNPTNPCEFCDTFVSPNSWTPRPSGAACSDGVWCNGSDTCNGTGSCADHAFPSGDRCQGNPQLCNQTCNEAAQNCFSPSTTECDSWTVTQCSSGERCGRDVESAIVTQNCPGTSALCEGAIQTGIYEPGEDCSAAEACSAGACVEDFSCGCEASGNYSDPATNLCWQVTPADGQFAQADARFHCEAGTWGGFDDWHLPSAAEMLTVMRGCSNGTMSSVTVPSACRWQPTGCTPGQNCDESLSNCAVCTIGQGPGVDGCYWHESFEGDCAYYWSDTVSFPGAATGYAMIFMNGTLWAIDQGGYLNRARCVRRGP